MPGVIHESSVAALEDVARLAGFSAPGPKPPSGVGRPDVLLLEPSRRGIFLGEVKATEQPTDGCAVRRLSGYVRWWTHVQRRRKTGGVLAVCVTDAGAAAGWLARLHQALVRSGTGAWPVRTHELGEAGVVHWVTAYGGRRLGPVRKV